jgi:hypothetical protein
MIAAFGEPNDPSRGPPNEMRMFCCCTAGRAGSITVLLQKWQRIVSRALSSSYSSGAPQAGHCSVLIIE